MNLSFAGCGFLGIYHVGVACCFRKYAPHLLLDKISGASAGAIAACALLCDIPLGDMTSDVLRVATAARRYSFGPLNPKFNIIDHLQEGLDKFLPEDVHLRVNGRLHISLTRCHDGKNVLVSQFDTRQDVIDVLLASAFIPIFSGMIPPKYKGVRYMDGGYSDNLPTLDENTITVSPFCGESDICPRDDSSQLFHINVANTSIELSRHNMYRIIRILFPPDPEILATMCKQGFDDALRFLHRNNLINCTRCLAVQSTFVVSKNTLVADNLEYEEYDPQCKECITHRQEALMSSMPDTMINVFQDAINSANNGLTSWLFRHKSMKLLSVLSLPYTIPADLMFATFAKFNFLPNMKTTPAMLSRKVTDFSFVSAVGDRFETRYFQHRILDNATAIFTSCTSEMRNDDARLMTAAPKITNTVWDLSKYFMDQVTYILNKVNRQRKQLNAKITCKLDVTEYDPNDVEACHDEMFAKNKMNLNFTLNYDSELDETNKHKNSNNHHHGPIERRSEVTINRPDTVDHDAFEHILQVTNQHETLMTYYYLDKNNEVKVTEILDVTESDSPIVQTSHERETNRSLEFDDEWDESTWTDQQQLPNYMYLDERRTSLTGMSEYSLEDLVLTDKDASNLFSDPESEWTGTYKVDMPEDETFQNDLMPESEQPVQLRHYVIEPLTLEE